MKLDLDPGTHITFSLGKYRWSEFVQLLIQAGDLDYSRD